MAIQSMNKFKRDENGGILVFVGMFLAVMLGMTAMVFDMGRMATTQTELQSFSDSVALAAAGELDGEPDSITRATNAAALVTGAQTFGEGSRTLSGEVDYTLNFAETLPDDDNAAIAFLADPFNPDQQRLASYVEVTITPRDVDLPFARAFAALSGNNDINNTVSAVSVAGYTSWACDITPLMFCVPNDEWTADANRGKSIYLRSGGSGAAWGPGDFGFLDVTEAKDPKGTCAGLNGSQLTACMIAALGNITACFQQNGVDTEPGQKVGIENSIFNTRFDMFNSMMSKYKTDPNYAPGPHVAKGFIASNGNGQCVGQSTVVADTMAFPPDETFDDSGRFGEGDWNIKDYIETNHGPVYEKDANGDYVYRDEAGEVTDETGTLTLEVEPSYMYDRLVGEFSRGGSYDYDGGKMPTRHEVYRKEIEFAKKSDGPGYNPIFAREVTDASGATKYENTRAESGIAQCSDPNNVVTMSDPDLTTPQFAVDRRIFIAAAINCDPITGTAINGKEKDVPVQEFVKIFLTQPVGEFEDTPPNFEFYVEVVGTAQGEGQGEDKLASGLIYNIVQMAR